MSYLLVFIIAIALVPFIVLLYHNVRSGGKKMNFGKSRARQLNEEDAASAAGSTPESAPSEPDAEEPAGPSYPADPDVVISKVTVPSELPSLPSCDHPRPPKYAIDFHGRTLELTDIPCCPQCLEDWLHKYCAVCAACGDPIMPGDEVATAWSGAPQPYTHLYMECCECGALYCGRWGGDGLIPLHVLHPDQFPPGTMTVMSHTFSSGQVVLVSGGQVQTVELMPEQKAALTIPEDALDQIAEENKKNRD